MNIFKNKASSALFISLILIFAAVAVHAETSKRSLFADNYGPIAADHSLATLYMSGNGQAKAKAAGVSTDADRTIPILLGGVAGNLIGIFGGWGLGDVLSPAHHSDHIAQGSPFGALIGSAFGSALGAYLAGNSKDTRGNLGSAVGGSLLGIAAAIAVSLPLIGMESGEGIYVAMAAFAILPPVGSAFFFNKSLRARTFPAGNGLLNLSEGKLGLGVPDIQISPLPVYGKNMKTELQFKINLLSVAL